MAFGQSSGPPATGKQLSELQELLEAAGHSDFRDARGPMGFTQRQAGGKFTRDEADEFIDQLQSEIYGDGPPGDSTPPRPTRAAPAPSKIAPRQPAEGRKPARAKAKPTKPAGSWKSNVSSKSAGAAKDPVDLEAVPTELLAAELQRRGWVVLEP